MSIEAMKMALEALELFCECGTMDRPIERREALRQAIEQAEKQEPVAYVTIDAALPGDWRKVPSIKWVDKPISGPLYIAPPKREWVGLTDEEKSALENKYKHIETGWRHDADLIAETEAKLKEKNCG